jgi:hypothetical protein
VKKASEYEKAAVMKSSRCKGDEWGITIKT